MMVISEIRYLRFYNCSVIETGGHSTKNPRFSKSHHIYLYIKDLPYWQSSPDEKRNIFSCRHGICAQYKKKKKKLTTPRNVNNVFIKNHKNKQ